jgi:UDP-2-acetamido-2,6-beta-L-arabino-hexul-4-ose reductase
MEKNSKIVITGSKGFVGKNLLTTLLGQGYTNVVEIDRNSNTTDLEKAVVGASWIFHLAGVNRPQEVEEFHQGNFGFTDTLLRVLKQKNTTATIVVSSTIQVAQDNPYGRSKLAAEQVLLDHQKQTNQPIYIYRLVNVFGKWAKPNYNSVVATFCHRIARQEAITIHDPSSPIRMVYIDDVVHEFIDCMSRGPSLKGPYFEVKPEYDITVGILAQTIESFAFNRTQLFLEKQADSLTKKLYATYLSYLQEDQFSYDLTMHKDHRGSFTELLKSLTDGQISVNVSKPGITKGNHYHHTKNEKFIVVSGRASIKFRKVGSLDVLEYITSGEKLQVVDIPPGYTHNITNIGEQDLVTIMWASEFFDQNNPDTYPMEVELK